MARGGTGRPKTRSDGHGRRRRWWGGAALLAVTAGGGAWLIADARLADMRRALVDRSNAMLGEPPSRVAGHGSGGSDDATVLDAVVAVYPSLVSRLTAWDRRKDPVMFDRCAEVREGRRPLAELPRPCEQMVDGVVDQLAALAVASRHVRMGDAADWQALKWWPVARASTAAALRARILLDREGSPRGALDLCVGMIELWAALTHVAALQSSTSAAVLVSDAFAVCGVALGHAGADARRNAIERLAAVHVGAAPLSVAVEREALLGEVAIFVPRLSDGSPEQLHPAAQRRAERSRAIGTTAADDAEPWWLEPFVLPPAWRAYVVTMADIAEVADRPGGDAIASIEAIIADDSMTHLTRTAVTHRWDRHVRAHHGARLRVELLWAAARLLEHRARTGAWPVHAPSLSGAPIELATAGREATLRVDDGDRVRTLVVRVP